jgi:hypothetical protein
MGSVAKAAAVGPDDGLLDVGDLGVRQAFVIVAPVGKNFAQLPRLVSNSVACDDLDDQLLMIAQSMSDKLLGGRTLGVRYVADIMEETMIRMPKSAKSLLQNRLERIV